MSELRPPGDIVLAIDDSPETLGFINDALTNAGMSVLVATGGAAALELLENITPDLILMDAIMPGMDGFSTCRAVKAKLALCNVPVVFMTGLSDAEHVLKGFAAGGVDYVTKPVDCNVLVARIRAHVAVARLARDARRTLDSTGQHVVSMRRDGRVLWATPGACALWTREGLANDLALPDAAMHALRAAGQQQPVSEDAWVPLTAALEFKVAGVSPADDVLLLLRERLSEQPAALLRDALGITPREADVLVWLCRGKTNRDIADILSLSPRTVDKHLEQIYAKLGVENRTSAASIGIAVIERRQQGLLGR